MAGRERPDSMQTIPFSGKILVLGCGGVARCFIPLLMKHVGIDPSSITIIDMVDNTKRIPDAIHAGVNYVNRKVTHQNYRKVLAQHVKAGDIIVDLAYNIGCTDLLDYCHNHDIRYVNTSVELWDPYSNADSQLTVDRTLYVRQVAIRRLVAGWKTKNGPTAILDHGANPGLVSHFTKMGLIQIAEKIIREKPTDARIPQLREALQNRRFGHLAWLTGVKVIHISERDTQISNRPKLVNEFVNTWSVEGLYEEGIAPAEIGWGTHEQSLPEDARLHTIGPRNQICLAQYGMNTWVRSWVPEGEILGMVIRHGEAFSISDYLTVYGETRDEVVYRPTVHYAYCPSDAAIASLHELRMRNYKLQPTWRIMDDDIVSGKDELGCLLMGHDFKSWWIGSQLEIDDARQLIPGQNATTLQVAASVLGALIYMINHPSEGVLLPDQLPHEEIMEIAQPYLGPIYSEPVDWVPSNYRDVTFTQMPDYPVADTDPWQFHRFLVV